MLPSVSAPRRRRASTQGFTLIELLMVVVIIGILASIVALKFSEMRERAFVSTMKSDLRNLSSAQEAYYTDSYQYSSDEGVLEYTSSEAVTISLNEATTNGWAATATHQALGTARQCGVFYGSATATNGSPATTPGSVVCN